MQKILALLILVVLTSCVHKIDIQQGNMIDPDSVKKLHLGMTQAQTETILGRPVLMNTFSDSRVDYVYTMKLGGSTPRTEKFVILTFQGNRLLHFSEKILNNDV